MAAAQSAAPIARAEPKPMNPEDSSGLSYRDLAARRWTGGRTIRPNKAMERSRILVTDRAIARSAPSIRLAHLGR